MKVKIKVKGNSNKGFEASAIVVSEKNVELYDIAIKTGRSKEKALVKLTQALAVQLENQNASIRAYRMAMMNLVGR